MFVVFLGNVVPVWPETSTNAVIIAVCSGPIRVTGPRFCVVLHNPPFRLSDFQHDGDHALGNSRDSVGSGECPVSALSK